MINFVCIIKQCASACSIGGCQVSAEMVLECDDGTGTAQVIFGRKESATVWPLIDVELEYGITWDSLWMIDVGS